MIYYDKKNCGGMKRMYRWTIPGKTEKVSLCRIFFVYLRQKQY